MAADYDRLFGIPEGFGAPDEVAAESDFDVNSTPVTPPARTGPPIVNGRPRPPMPVDWTHQIPPAQAELAVPRDTNGAVAPSMPIERTRPATPDRPQPPELLPMRADRTDLRSPASPNPPSVNGDRPQPEAQHGRHARHRANSHPPRSRANSSAPVPNAQATSRTSSAAASGTASTAGDHHEARQPGLGSAAKKSSKAATKMVPQRGWRRRFYAVTRINPGLSSDEKVEIELYTRIRRAVRGSYQIGVVGLKGGVGKTAVTAALGSVFAQVRGDRILAVDADQVSGNLADRVGRQTSASVEDLLAGRALSHYNDVRAHTSSNAVNLEVLAAAEYRPARRPIGEDEWQRAVSVVPRYYNLVVADCGADFFDPATRGVLSTASGLVIVSSASGDGARQAEVAINWLRQSSYRALLNHACVVINHVAAGEPNVRVAELVRRFEQCVQPGRVVVLPWDRHVMDGTEIQIDRLGGTFKRRIVELAAALSDDFNRSQRR